VLLGSLRLYAIPELERLLDEWAETPLERAN